MKTLLIFAIAAILFMPMPALAADFTVNLTADNSYMVGKTGTSSVLIKNNGESGWFGVSILGVESWGQILPSGSRVWIDSGYTGSTTVYISPPTNADPKMYSFSIIVTRSSTGAVVEKQLLIQVNQLVDAQLVNFTKSCSECEGSIDFSVDVKNVGTQPFSGTLTVTVADVPRNYQLEIARNSEQHVSDSFDLSGFKPGEYSFLMVLNSTGRHIQKITQDFKIGSIGNVTYTKKTSSSPFGNSVVLTATNIGNVPETATMHAVITKAWYAIYSGPAPSEMIDNKYAWTRELVGSGSATIAYAEIFWPMPLIIIALAIVGIFFYMQMAALSVKKIALGRTVITPGRDIGITLSVKNMKKKVDSITLRDIVPSAFSIGGKFDATKPVIRKLHNGTELIWKMNDLKPGEERMVHYKITPNINVYGGCVLSAAIAHARTGNKIIERRSNTIVLQGAPRGGVHKLSVEVDK